ncbi:MAG: hypothetical protein ABSB87_14215 [Terriglobales bacterium]
MSISTNRDENRLIEESSGGNRVPKYVIEREIPGAGKLTSQQLRVISQASCGIVQTLGPQIQWV